MKASHALYECPTTFLVNNGFQMDGWDKNLFVQIDKREVVISQVYAVDIIFGSTKDDLAQDFSLTMQNEFEMSLVGKLNCFLRFQMK